MKIMNCQQFLQISASYFRCFFIKIKHTAESGMLDFKYDKLKLFFEVEVILVILELKLVEDAEAEVRAVCL